MTNHTQPHILLVDDNTTFLNILEQSMRAQHHTVCTADNPDAAMQLCEQHTFSHAVFDLNIDGASGLNLLTRFLAQQTHCKVLILTGYASVATAVEAMRLGALDYLCKPASIQDILQSLQLNQTDLTEKTTRPGSESAPIETESFEPMSVKRMEWEHIQKVLIENNGNITATAKALNMHRRTLQRKLQKRPVKQ